MQSRTITLSLAITTLFAVWTSGVTAAEIRLHGAIPVVKQILKPIKTEVEKDSGTILAFVGNGTQNGIKDLVEGRAQIALLGATLEEVVPKLGKAVPNFDPTGFKSYFVGESPARLIVHPSNPVNTLSVAQASGLLSGTITNWKEVGGSSSPVVVVAGPSGSGARAVVENVLLKDSSLSRSTRVVPNLPQVTTVVKQLPSAIGIVIDNAITSEVKVVQMDVKFSQQLFLLTKGEPTGDIAKVVKAILARVKK
jgi:phosphate transport system substrate-binding protein